MKNIHHPPLARSQSTVAEVRTSRRPPIAVSSGQGGPQRSQTVQTGHRPAFSGIAHAILRAQEETAAKPPTSLGPDLRSVSEWTIADDLTNAQEILQQASALGELLFQLDEGNATGIQAALEKIPPEVGHYEHHFPPAPMDLPYAHLHTMARTFENLFPSLAADRLLILIGDCHQRQEAQMQVAVDLKDVSGTHFNRKYAPDLQAVCWALRETPELELREKAEGITSLIERLLTLKDRDLVRELATQPTINLRMASAKCAVLAAASEDRADTITAFRNQVEAARDMQKTASALLRKELLEDPLDAEKIAALALVEYAKETTSIAIDYVSAGTRWEELPVMHAALRTVRAHFADQERATEFPLEAVALDWVYQQIGYTLSLPH